MGTHKKRRKLPQGRNRQEAEIAAELTAPSHTDPVIRQDKPSTRLTCRRERKR